MRAEEIPPTKAPTRPPAIASCVAVLPSSSDESSLSVSFSDWIDVDNTDDVDAAVVDDVGLIRVLADGGTLTSVPTGCLLVVLDNSD